MKIVYSEDHRKHFPQGEIFGGELVTPFERPSRMEYVLRELKARKMTDFVAPGVLDFKPVQQVHDAGYLEFLEKAWDMWMAAGYRGEVTPACIPTRGLRQRKPKSIDGLVGYYIHSIETMITAGTWDAARASASVAQTAQRLVTKGDRAAFALCRPPGHHAHSDLYGGYCFLNNAAIAAQGFLNNGAKRVAILDVDVHHGNGTQEIFYKRDDVMFLSIHGDPDYTYPQFLGWADETGEGKGEGFNINYPIAPGGKYDVWGAALDDACKRIKAYAPDVVVVSLGVDTFKDDPISPLKLESKDFTTYGGVIAKLKLPTLIVMEGGYAIDAIGTNTVNVLEGFENA
jgi:acetoin utilization deacetylase AcuC-like enzyme